MDVQAQALAVDDIASILAACYYSQMSKTLDRIIALVGRRDIRISDHGYDEIAADGISVRDIVVSLPEAEQIEDYPEFGKGSCVLVLQYDANGRAIHAVWGIPKGQKSPAVLVTAYQPDPAKWTEDFRSRRK